MSEAVNIVLEEREGFGKAYCGRLRKTGYFPAVVFRQGRDEDDAALPDVRRREKLCVCRDSSRRCR